MKPSAHSPRAPPALPDDADDDIVRNELAAVHEAASPEGLICCAVFDRFAQDIAGRDGRESAGGSG
jgi:hypothetical protein